jgi:hypothetical protein
METIKFILNGLCMLIFMGSCIKEPKACFTADKVLYTAGETIHLINCSVDAESYHWDFPDGSSSSSKNPDYITNINAPDYSINISLKVCARNKNKYSVESHNLKINPPVFSSDSYAIEGYEGGYYYPYQKSITVDKTKNVIILSVKEKNYTGDTMAMKLNITFKGINRPNTGTYDINSGDVVLEYVGMQAGVDYYYFGFDSHALVSKGNIYVSQTESGRLRIKFESIEVFPRVYGTRDPVHSYGTADLIF